MVRLLMYAFRPDAQITADTLREHFGKFEICTSFCSDVFIKFINFKS